MAIGLEPYRGKQNMTHDAAANFRYQREQRHRRLVTEQSTNQLDYLRALFLAERTLMDAEDRGRVCICCGPDLHHYLILTMAAKRSAASRGWNKVSSTTPAVRTANSLNQMGKDADCTTPH
jgi:hypothetical protein